MFSVAAAPTDAVPLVPAWSALFASVRFARSSSWQFGNTSSIVQCLEHVPGRFWTERPASGLRFRFDLQRWSRAFARSTGSGREFCFVADDGRRIASLQLEHVDSAIDEFIWRLVDDDALCGEPASPDVEWHTALTDRARIGDELALADSRETFDAIVRRSRIARADALALAGPNVARRLAPLVLSKALHDASEAGLRVRARIDNAGGAITWEPAHAAVATDVRGVTLCGPGIDVTVRARGAGIWAVALDTPDVCCPVIECCTPGDPGGIRIDVVAQSDAQCATWRRICATLEEE